LLLILKESKGNSEGKIAQAKLLYDIITTHKGAYSTLIESLKKTVQIGSFDLLEQQNEREQELEKNSLELIPYVPQEESCLSSSKILALPPPPQHNLNIDNVYASYFSRKWEHDQEIMAKVRWIPSTSASLHIDDFFSAGRESLLPTHVARIFHEGEWIPGKCLMGEWNLPRLRVILWKKI